MKLPLLFLLLLTVLFGAACGSLTNVVGTAGSAAAGAAIGHQLDPKRGAPIGAAGGALLFQGAYVYQNARERRAYDDGFVQAQGDGVRRYDEMLRTFHAGSDEGEQVLPILIQAHTTNGVHFAPTTTTLHLTR